ncbi:V-type ATP synthase subunit B [Flagellimonas meridianipacifica]|uniref:V/A-type H+-transporting ATPase subunit B n=1 Tax=Flagellimonas meridianipacifica TaxID=1080225 RepID=A0A2T0MD62_9FLAO|nr:V-type ATP synthase subunit B [Allomuricauda pacifica]PRX55416.1 V/A-type H+-transporting ATPase subunit B [Allomuricauda pacifica]
MLQKTYENIDSIGRAILSINAQGVHNKELAEVIYPSGEKAFAQVIALDGDQVTLQLYGGGFGVSTNCKIRFLGKPIEVGFSDDMLGRVYSGNGQPIDGGPELLSDMVRVAGPSINPVKRLIPKDMIRTGVPMIDVFNTLVRSQKIPIFAKAGEPYNRLLANIATQTDADIIIIGGVGLKYDEYHYFRERIEQAGSKNKTIMFIHTHRDSIVEGLMVPDLTLAVAEQFALQGKNVFVLLSDMTQWSDYLRQVANAQDQIPANQGYPGDLYSQLASRYEKAADIEGAGSLTVLGVTTMDDVTHPVPDNTGYITEGQFYMKDGYLELFGSLSRLKQQVNDRTRTDHRSIMNAMARLLSEAEERVKAQKFGSVKDDYSLRLLEYRKTFQKELMDPFRYLELEDALDICWDILAQHFKKEEVGLSSKLIEDYWPEQEEQNN